MKKSHKSDIGGHIFAETGSKATISVIYAVLTKLLFNAMGLSYLYCKNGSKPTCIVA